MHVCSTLWTGALADDLDMSAADRAAHERPARMHYRRIVEHGAIYSQPFSEGGAAAAGGVAFGTEAKPVDGGFLVNGKKIFASLSGAADYYGMLCTERAEGEQASRRNTLYLAVPANAPGVSVVGDWDPLGMRGTVSRTLLVQGRVRAGERAADAARRLFPGGDALAAHVPHAVADLYGPRAGGLRFHRRAICAARCRARRRSSGACIPTKQIAVAEMHIMLEQTKALWFQAISEARANPTKEQVLRAYAAQYTVMENANAHRRQGDPHLRRPGDAEEPAARAHLSRQPLRLADAAVDRRDLPRPPRPRDAVRAGRDG